MSEPPDEVWQPPAEGSVPSRPAPGPMPPGPAGPYPPAPYGQAPYGQPPYGPYGGYGPPPTTGTNGLAIASMVLGILWLYWLGSILALIFGYVARRQIRERHQSGDGMAIAGIVLGWIGVGFLLLFLFLAVVAGAGVFG